MDIRSTSFGTEFNRPPKPNPINPQQNFRPSFHPLPPPEPMEVDPSLRSRNLNYGNRPPFNAKRPYPPPSQQHPNIKRQAYPLEEMYHDTEEYYYVPYYYDPYCDYDSYYNDETQQATEPQNRPDVNDAADDENSTVQNNTNVASTNFLEWTSEW